MSTPRRHDGSTVDASGVPAGIAALAGEVAGLRARLDRLERLLGVDDDTPG